MATGDVIPVVDLRPLSHSEICAIAASSAASSAAISALTDLDAAAPKVDRSVFNESAGSRKQTYSRIRLAPRTTTITNPSSAAVSGVPRRRGRPRSNPAPPPAPPLQQIPNDDPEQNENRYIASLLRSLLDCPKTRTTPISKAIVPLEDANVNPVFPIPISVVEGNLKVPTLLEKKVVVPALLAVDERDKEILNAKDVALDLLELGQKLDPYADELKRRTAGLSTAEQLLGYLSGLDGQWGSRRRRKKIVDAAGFGDHLPKGWKLFLGIRRKERLAWLDVRKYISPSGKKFVSCNEVSSYIISLVGFQDVRPPNTSQNKGNVPMITNSSTANQNAGPNNNNGILKESPSDLPLAPLVAPSTVDTNNDASRFANQANVGQINIQYPQTSFRTLNHKRAQVQQVSTPHRRSRKRRKLVKTIGDGVIVNKEGMFECQFCHKSFTAMRSYYGHVGTHVRYEGLTAETPTEVASNKSTVTSVAAVPCALPYKRAREATVGKEIDTPQAAAPSITTAVTAIKASLRKGNVMITSALPCVLSSGGAVEAAATKSIDTPVAGPPSIMSVGMAAETSTTAETAAEASSRKSIDMITSALPCLRSSGGAAEDAATKSIDTPVAGPPSALSVGMAAETIVVKSVDTSVAAVGIPSEVTVGKRVESSAAAVSGIPTEVVVRNEAESPLSAPPSVSSRNMMEFTAKKSIETSISAVPCAPMEMDDFNSKSVEDPSSAVGSPEAMQSVCGATNSNFGQEIENQDLNNKPNCDVPNASLVTISNSAGYQSNNESDPSADDHSCNSKQEYIDHVTYGIKEFVEPSGVDDSMLNNEEDVSNVVYNGPCGVIGDVAMSKPIDDRKDEIEMSDNKSEEVLEVINGGYSAVCFEDQTPSVIMDKVDFLESEHRRPSSAAVSKNDTRSICDVATKCEEPSGGTNELYSRPVECVDTLQLSCAEENNSTPGMFSEMELSSGTLNPEIDKSRIDQIHASQCESISLTNGSNCGIRNFVQSFLPCTLEEGSFAQRDASLNGMDIDSNGNIIVDKAVGMANILQNVQDELHAKNEEEIDLQRCVLTLFDDRNDQTVELNSDCTFQSNITKSLLEETNQPPTELELFDIRTSGYYDDVVSDVVQNAISGGPLPVNVTDTWVQPSPGPAFFDMIPDQCETEQNLIGHPTNLVLFAGHGLSSVSEPQLELGYGAQVESRQMDWGISLGASVSSCGVTSVCVWCGRQFNHETANVQLHPDSLGFMCPTCKARIE